MKPLNISKWQLNMDIKMEIYNYAMNLEKGYGTVPNIKRSCKTL